MSPHSDGWYYSSNGQVFGPVVLDDVHILVRSGQLGQQDSVRHVAWDRWFTVEHASVQLRLSPASPPAAPPPPRPSATPPPPAPLAGSPTPSPVPTAGSHGAAPVNSAQRLASWVIDVAAIGLFAFVVASALPGVLAAFVQCAAFFGYMVWLPLKGFARLGHVVVGLRVVRAADDARPLDLLTLGTRAATLVLLALPFFVGMVFSTLSMFAHDRAQAWHDVASGTTVVKVKPWDFGRATVRP